MTDNTKSRLYRRLLAAAAMVGLAAATAGCSTNPATGKQDVVFMSQSDEKRVGDENHPKVLKQFGGAYDDPELQSYVKSLGQVLAASSELPNIKWTFTLLDSDVTNAFALPGGYVYITRGLVSLAETEAQLAAVIGHEIGHVTARHGAQRHAQGTLAQVGALGASIAGAIFGGAQTGRAVGQLAGVGAQAYVASYSRDQEYEADGLGIRYNSRVGFDPEGMAGFLAKLDAEKALIAKLRGQAPRGSTYFDTHPPTPDRVARARALAARTPAKGATDGRDVFLSKIDGMIWGDSPDQGYARDGVFAHGGLNIRYEVPDGFTLFNSPNQVTAFGPGGAAIVFDTGPKNYGGSMRDYIAQTWGRNARLSDLQTIDVNGLDAATATTRGNAQGRAADVRLVAIRGREGHTFRLVFFSPSNRTRALATPYRETTYSFRHMTGAERRALKPLRIRIYTVRRGDTIDRVVRRQMDIKKFAKDRFLLLNGLRANSRLKVGQKVKVIKEGSGRGGVAEALPQVLPASRLPADHG